MIPSELRDHVVRPTLEKLGLWSLSAEQLVIGTICVESNCRYLKQINGPALGIIQMEPATHADIWRNYLEYRQPLSAAISELVSVGASGGEHPNHEELITNLAYAVAMCRVHYLRRPEPLPKAGDIAAMARFWKSFYNTNQGKGSVAEFVERFPREIL